MLAHRIITALKSILVDHSTPVTVVASTYSTSGNGGRKLVSLSNGWLVVAEYSSNIIYLQVSKDNGANFSALCNIQNSTSITSGFAIASSGTNVTVLFADGATTISSCTFDAAIVSNTNIYSTTNKTVDSGQTAIGSGRSITCDSSSNLYATWCSKNSTYQNNFNIRHAKSADGGTTWTKANGTAGVDQLTTENDASSYNQNPTIIINGSIIFIAYENKSTTINASIAGYRFNGSTWNAAGVYVSGSASYLQYSPCAAVSPDGTIHVAWNGTDSTDTAYTNIRYSKSTDNGVTWSAMQKLTVGNSYYQQVPSIAADKNNNIYVVWQGIVSTISTTLGQIREIVYNGSWGAITNLTTNPSASSTNPSVCANYTDFTDPLCIYTDSGAGAVKFRGVFTV